MCVCVSDSNLRNVSHHVFKIITYRFRCTAYKKNKRTQTNVCACVFEREKPNEMKMRKLYIIFTLANMQHVVMVLFSSIWMGILAFGKELS